MEILQVFNNNVVLSKNEAGEEIVCMGRGLAFGRKAGQQFDRTKVEKEFVLKDSQELQQFEQLLTDIQPEELEAVREFVDLAEHSLKIKLLPSVFLNLTDHVHYAIERQKSGITLANPLLFETKKYYPEEYYLAKQALVIIQTRLGVLLPEEEAGFIAFHLVNSQQDSQNMQQTMQATKLVRDILTLIRRFFGKTFDEESLAYQRMVTHLQYFAQRYVRNENLKEQPDEFLYALVQGKYPQAFQCVQRINDYLHTQHLPLMEESEQIYLTIHIQRIVTE
ncbi:BglG family transcription antiterminator LicT [Enterococcus cecorum]|uniref:BglG family transcription antiterminator LicT n=1 Tax=Enterococcus cecorum TaxID=44008 RepID=UPI00064365EC|nr:PRD domain-containing protein [Enterococcus cecorum]KLO72487.1 transcription antiterminator BglG [Enterococcus cecorum]MCJ0571268.1 PRD domain-containing protein [Enterococcus cecorum]MCJ0573112.1 PRD domain-containing protein [Enterococcus cecorum]MCJ0575010.1 PRD domain-containing protein [Enterococcus cecorum]MCJ0577081.1 PRD domain-containing protein [Enterococcus cecorum]